ncbi:uncharacterized protein LOC126469865 isoform X2 [Schistocerca serialis cubense]|uniref:uncharacterized protein LOC126298763 isoform X3 n=1 Tax=Schistocerca gregaria TaxID=7010 RepID=UPI00211DF66F|nr:uncharacterized protein LOC126298763 isoform X3 [Schistocerca gregaria]XP_049953132.1 uncharacterized protein LOC126469865 isoform X2 [Schistocerca serialis cubense]
MNILFRKHFHGDSDGGGYGGRLGPSSRGVRRSREPGYTAMETHAYRTHIFLTPTAGGCQGCAEAAASEASSPRRPSVTLMKWAVGGGGGTRRKASARPGSDPDTPTPTPTPTASRQVSFSNTVSPQQQQQQQHQHQQQQQQQQQQAPAEPVTLATLNRDCFIIPVASLDRFLPAGVPMPLTEKSPSFLSVLEVDDPKLCVLLHLMTAMEPIEPVLESPLARPLAQQKTAASDLLCEVGSAKTASEGMLLSNMEKNAEFPFISYYVINKSQTDPVDFFRNLRAASLRKFDPRSLRYTAAHTLDLFNEVATIARPPLDTHSKRPNSAATGYIISVYKVFEGDDGEKFEKNWLYWTGARMLYRYLPKSVGLRRITLHKSLSSGDKMYLLLCECSNFLENLSAAALLLPALRARLCGYTGLYRTTASF